MKKKHLIEESSNSLQKRVLKYLEPESLLDVEKELEQLLRAESALMKLSSRFNVSPHKLQKSIEDLIDIIDIVQF